jgi:peptidyl-tRNA hydrolase, PTH2 family
MPANPKGAGELKAVLVVRGELRLTPGKAAVQVAHAAVMLALEAEHRHAALFKAWEAGGARKIALVVETLDELEQLQRLARARGLPTVIVQDAGLTEVPPGTRTVLGIGPAKSEEVDPITGSLPLL